MFDFIMNLLALPDKTAAAVCAFPESRRRAIAETAYSGEDMQFPIINLTPDARLAATVQLLTEKYPACKNLGVPENIIRDTFRDVTLRARLHEERYGAPGLTDDDAVWFRHIMNLNIFQIGPIQYQPFSMIYLDKETLGEDYMEISASCKAALPPDTPVINCHVPFGADLKGSRVADSLSEADNFFKVLHPEISYRAFICYSWLLYPPMLRRLGENSAIRRFARHFTITGWCGDNEQAMENLFPCGKPAHEENLTSLQKTALAYPDVFGYALGVIQK